MGEVYRLTCPYCDKILRRHGRAYVPQSFLPKGVLTAVSDMTRCPGCEIAWIDATVVMEAPVEFILMTFSVDPPSES